jgi:ABC-2 type transport system ATP-binding protein
MTAIELRNVRKSFGKHHVLNDVNLNVEAARTYAFLGRNGAGKTTTIRMLMGLIKPDAGTIRVLGLDPARDPLTIRQQVGYLAEDQQMWGWMTVAEIIRFMGPFYPGWDTTLAQRLLDQFALSSHTKIKHLSKGQNVRLGLLLALAHRPRLMILDDPALGLDPIMRKEFLRDVVEHLQGSDVTVFFSSHLLYEVEPVADTIGILDAGRIACELPTEVLRERVRQIRIARQDWETVAKSIHSVLDLKPDGHQVAVTVSDMTRERPALAGVAFEESALNLDEIFEAYVAGKRPAPPPHREPSFENIGGAR